MGTCFTQVESVEVPKFTQLSKRFSEYGEPIRKRQCTDKFFIYFMAEFLIVLFGFLIYCSTIGDVSRIIHGYDDCGNVCGKPNERQGDDVSSCVGKDNSQQRFLVTITTKNSQNRGQNRFYDSTYYTYSYNYSTEKKCVESCEKYGFYEDILGRCISKKIEHSLNLKRKSELQELVEDLQLCSNEIIYMTIISFLFVGAVIILFRYFTACFIWCLLIGASAFTVIATITFWGLSNNSDNNKEKRDFQIFAIIFTIISIVIIFLILVMRKRIKMVIQLFQEASKAIGALPLLLLQPIATFFAFLLTFLFNTYVLMLLLSAGNLTKLDEGKYEYLSNDAVVATSVLAYAGTIWLMYFYIGCQDMIVGGSVASWYFIRDKSKLGSPIMYSAYNVVRFHLGTVAFGSFIMVIMEIVRVIIESIKRRMSEFGCCLCLSCIFEHLQQIIQYFSKLAYIMTAMHGVTFCQGGKQAMKLFMNNGINMLALNSAGSFILFLVHFIIVLPTVLIGVNMLDKPGINNIAGPVFVVGAIAFCWSKCFLTVYDTAIDTIFLCFCEDCELNDGITKEYYMSKELMLFVENSKKALANLDKSKKSSSSKTWNFGNNKGRHLRSQQPAPIA